MRYAARGVAMISDSTRSIGVALFQTFKSFNRFALPLDRAVPIVPVVQSLRSVPIVFSRSTFNRSTKERNFHVSRIPEMSM